MDQDEAYHFVSNISEKQMLMMNYISEKQISMMNYVVQQVGKIFKLTGNGTSSSSCGNACWSDATAR